MASYKGPPTIATSGISCGCDEFALGGGRHEGSKDDTEESRDNTEERREVECERESVCMSWGGFQGPGPHLSLSLSSVFCPVSVYLHLSWSVCLFSLPLPSVSLFLTFLLSVRRAGVVRRGKAGERSEGRWGL